MIWSQWIQFSHSAIQQCKLHIPGQCGLQWLNGEEFSLRKGRIIAAYSDGCGIWWLSSLFMYMEKVHCLIINILLRALKKEVLMVKPQTSEPGDLGSDLILASGCLCGTYIFVFQSPKATKFAVRNKNKSQIQVLRTHNSQWRNWSYACLPHI